MNRLLILLCTILCPAWGVASASRADVRVHSAECLYGRAANEVCFSLRIHIQAPQGSTLAEPTNHPVERSPLIGVDATGRPLVGGLRSIESCMDNCRILVYDFYARPQGGWVEFDTSILLPMSNLTYDLMTEPFDPRLPGTVRVRGHAIFRTPLPFKEGEAKPNAVLFHQECEPVPLLRSVSFCNEDHSRCKSSMLSADYDETSGMTSSTCLLHPAGDLVCMVLHCMHPAKPCPVRVRLRIHAGGVTQL